jgi:hypothetical protein
VFATVMARWKGRSVSLKVVHIEVRVAARSPAACCHADATRPLQDFGASNDELVVGLVQDVVKYRSADALAPRPTDPTERWRTQQRDSRRHCQVPRRVSL